jgi:hypothetical protein
MEDNQGKNEVESTLRFNSEWLNEENQSLSPEHQAAVDALPARHALLVVRAGPNPVQGSCLTAMSQPSADIQMRISF